MEQEQIQQFIDNKTPVFIDRSYYFLDKPTIILSFCGNPEFVKVEGSTDAYETYRLRPAPMRITRSRKQKQVSPNGLPIIYVGRPTKWGNPFKVTGQDGHWFVMSDDGHPLVNFEKKEDAIACCVENYKEYITHEHNLGIKNIADLIDKNLSCWCAKDCLCHADVLMDLAAKIKNKKIVAI